MKHQERVKIATERYRKKLKSTRTSNFAINLALSSGLDFLMYYRTAHKKLKNI